MNCTHGRKATECYECYREISSERGLRILEVGRAMARKDEEIKGLRAEVEQLRMRSLGRGA